MAPSWEIAQKGSQCGGLLGLEAGLPGPTDPTSTPASSFPARFLSDVSLHRALVPSHMETRLLWTVPPNQLSSPVGTLAPCPTPGHTANVLNDLSPLFTDYLFPA